MGLAIGNELELLTDHAEPECIRQCLGLGETESDGFVGIHRVQATIDMCMGSWDIMGSWACD